MSAACTPEWGWGQLATQQQAGRLTNGKLFYEAFVAILLFIFARISSSLRASFTPDMNLLKV